MNSREDIEGDIFANSRQKLKTFLEEFHPVVLKLHLLYLSGSLSYAILFMLFNNIRGMCGITVKFKLYISLVVQLELTKKYI